MRQLFFILLLSLLTITSNAQTTFIKIFADDDATMPLAGRHIIKTPDNNYSFLCTNNSKQVVIRIDESGNEFNRFSIQYNRLNPVCLALTHQGKYCLVGRDSTELTAYIEFSDTNGTLQSHTWEWGAVGGAQAHGVYKTPDNGLMYSFWNNSEMCYDPEYFRKEDSVGNFVWERVSSFNMINPSKQSFQFMPGDRLCAIAPYLTGCYDTIQYYFSRLSLYSSIGTYATYNFTELYHTVDTTYGGGFILASSNQFQKFDTLAGAIWTNPMPPNMSFPIALRQLPDSSFILAGDQLVTGFGRQLIINKYDWNGNLLWSHDYGGRGDEYFSNMLLEPDGGFLISGRSSSYGQRMKAIILKVDSAGNSSPMPSIAVSSNAICSGDSTALSLPSGYTYLWNTGETRQTIFASDSGSYSAILTDTGGVQIFTDTITLNVLPTTKPNLGPDVTLCLGQNFVLDAGSGYSSYEWNTGSFEQMDTVNTNGNYIVHTIDSNACSTYDTVQVSFITLPPFTLGPDISQCDLTPITLNSPGILQWYWSDGSSDTTFTVNFSGTYYLTFTNGVCSDTDYIDIAMNVPVQVDLIDDSTTCINQSVLLDAGPNFVSYQWQDGTLSQFYTATSSVPGTFQYTVQTIDLNGCSSTDDVIIDFEICPSTNDFEFAKSFFIYPNPVSSSSNLIVASAIYPSVAVKIISITGEVVYENNLQHLPAKISTSNIASGIYFLKITDTLSGKESTVKLVVQ